MNIFNTFSDLSIPKPLASGLDKMKFIKPTPVQTASIPSALKGKDVLGTAQTGTGKTGAFGIPLLAQIYANPGKMALVLAPTRELAAQIFTVLRQMSKGMKIKGCLVVGGESFGRQVRAFERGLDFVVATPGRLNDHLQEGTADISKVSFLVLDEVDRMLDMGFAPQIKQVAKYLPKKRQTLLFSATLPKEAAGIASKFLQDPIRVDIEPDHSNEAKIEVITVNTTQPAKAKLILTKLTEHPGKALIFTRTKSRTERVARILGKEGHKVVNLHGGRTQRQRKRALDMFRSGTHPVMVATDIAGRGIDVTDIETVINYDLPEGREDYIHRIGRTGRNGRQGTALNFITPEDSDSEEILTGKKPAKQKSASRNSRSNSRGRKRSGKFSFSKDSREEGPRSRSKSPRRGASKFERSDRPKRRFSNKGNFSEDEGRSERTTRPESRKVSSSQRYKSVNSKFGERKERPSRDSESESRSFGKKPFKSKRTFSKDDSGEKRPYGKKPFNRKGKFAKDGDSKDRPFEKRTTRGKSKFSKSSDSDRRPSGKRTFKDKERFSADGKPKSRPIRKGGFKRKDTYSDDGMPIERPGAGSRLKSKKRSLFKGKKRAGGRVRKPSNSSERRAV